MYLLLVCSVFVEPLALVIFTTFSIRSSTDSGTELTAMKA